jgi:hypothetical protein
MVEFEVTGLDQSRFLGTAPGLVGKRQEFSEGIVLYVGEKRFEVRRRHSALPLFRSWLFNASNRAVFNVTELCSPIECGNRHRKGALAHFW